MRLRYRKAGAVLVMAGLMAPAGATTYTLANPADSVVGGDKSATTVYEDTLYDLARKLQPRLGGTHPRQSGRGSMDSGCRQADHHSRPAHPAARPARGHRGQPARASALLLPQAAARPAARRSSPIRSASARWTGARRSASHMSSARTRIRSGTRPSRCARSMRPQAIRCRRCVPPGPDNPLGPVRDAAGRRQRHLPDPRHQQPDRRGAGRHTRLHSHVPGGCRAACSR